MAKTPSPLQTKRIPQAVDAPTPVVEAAATVAESALAPAASARKPKPPAPTRAAKPAKAAAPKKAAAKPAAKAPEAAPVVADKPAKAHKPKLVRDSFTIPKIEYQVLDALKSRALGLEHHARKSELLRAGIQVLAAMNDESLLKALAAVPTLKTGRPKAD